MTNRVYWGKVLLFWGIVGTIFSVCMFTCPLSGGSIESAMGWFALFVILLTISVFLTLLGLLFVFKGKRRQESIPQPPDEPAEE